MTKSGFSVSLSLMSFAYILEFMNLCLLQFEVVVGRSSPVRAPYVLGETLSLERVLVSGQERIHEQVEQMQANRNLLSKSTP